MANTEELMVVETEEKENEVYEGEVIDLEPCDEEQESGGSLAKTLVVGGVIAGLTVGAGKFIWKKTEPARKKLKKAHDEKKARKYAEFLRKRGHDVFLVEDLGPTPEYFTTENDAEESQDEEE